MEIINKLIDKANLSALIERFNTSGKKVFAPVTKNGLSDFAKVESVQEIDFDCIATIQSAKSLVFPKHEKLLSFEKTYDDVKVKEIDLSEIPEVVAFGGRPCDAAGFIPLNAIFTTDSVDEIFKTRLEKLSLISISCKKADDFCFCTSVNGSPCNTAGSDILLTEISESSYYAEIITEKGKAILDANTDLFKETTVVDKTPFVAKIDQLFSTEAINEKLKTLFESDIWDQQAMRCVGCGACAFVCPACGCFDIQDETKGKDGVRHRCWDSCGFKLFTMHTSGHNPREKQAQRWRQRIFHKFSYQPEQQSQFGCVGCGRCSRACPSDMNIAEHLKNIAAQ
ncbi:MAG: 4Fe-4S dicluster domain-containing protein [Bacteroidales bacterium]